jgi:geranylgeranyl reductase
MFDFAIIGGGPAGSTLARLLAREHKIALFEKRDLESSSHGIRNEKCCGGLLAPDAQNALAALSLGLPRSLVVDPQLFAVRSIDLPSGLERCYQRHYLNIDRFELDRWLWSLVPDRAVKFQESLVTGFSPGPRGFIVSYRRGGREYAVEARAVIGAEGSRSLVRSRLADREPARRYFCVEEWFECPASPPYFSALFDPAITDFYAWTIPKNGTILLGAALDPLDRPLEKFELLKQKVFERGLVLGHPIKKNGGFLLRPRHWGSVILGGGGLISVGEAAGLVSPSSGEGLSFAFRSAMLLASAVLRHGDKYQQAYERSAAKFRTMLLVKNLKASFLCRPRIRRAIMAVGLRSVRVESDMYTGPVHFADRPASLSTTHVRQTTEARG